ncbi:muscle M-line assembly protein unc-89-like [Chanodichthys erythropterus]|uniref:muscle M-line assembly protein unc-89-like n=1 Tax=Chanodichthys erythropterus TaxID=933992 RepID=UPI00351EF4E8
MRNNTFLFWVLLLVDGVFGSDKVISVSVMEGDSVTLRTDLTEIQGDSKIIWNYGTEIIAKIQEGNPSLPNSDEKFRDRLKLDEQTGSLTITNIRSEHAGDYSVDVKTTISKSTILFKVTVHDHVDSVPVMQGDSVTLHTGVTDIQRDDPILWKFGDQIILTDRLNAAVDERWRNIDLNDQTREITIRNIRTDQSGDYKMEFNSIRMILHKKFSVTVGGVFSDEKDGVKTVSKKTGTDVLLDTHVTKIQNDDISIEWTFGPQNISIAKLDGKSKNKIYNYNDLRFKNRLYLQIETGDLTISDANSEHSGLYQLKIMNNTYTIQKRFSVTVSDSGSSAAVSGGVSFGLLVWAVTVLLLQEV